MIIDKNERIELAATLGIQCTYDALFQMAERLVQEQVLASWSLSFSEGTYHGLIEIPDVGDKTISFWSDDDDPFTALGTPIAKALEEKGNETDCSWLF